MVYNCYYLDSINIVGHNISSEGEAITESYMKSKELYNKLNTLGVWTYRKNGYPILSIKLPANLVECTEITIYNTIKKFTITTDVEELNGTKYTTSPHIDLKNLSIEKDSNGEYILPTNATGIYGENAIEVNYYYEVEPIKLTVHHYLEGTENKLIDDETILRSPNVTFDEDGSYSISRDSEYVVNDKKYKERLKENYNISKIVDTKGNTLNVGDTFEYNEDTEIIYYYISSKYKYKIEYYYDNVKQEDLTEKLEANYNDIITDFKDKAGDSYILDKVIPAGQNKKANLKITDNEETNVIRVYYASEYKITTYVIKHKDNYKDGTTSELIKGGKISGECKNPYEKVIKGGVTSLPIEIIPDAGYEISRILINGEKYIFSKEELTDGKLILKPFKNVQNEF